MTFGQQIAIASICEYVKSKSGENVALIAADELQNIPEVRQRIILVTN